MDETDLRVEEDADWLHVIGDGTLTSYRLGGRGDIWKAYVGTAVHDRFASDLIPRPGETAPDVCNAHLLHNLEEVIEWEKALDGWAARRQRLLRKARDDAAYWGAVTGGPVPEPLHRETAADWDALLILQW